MSLTGDGKLSVLNGLDGDLEGNASTATTAANLTRNVNAGAGLIGGGSLNGQSVTLNVGQGSGITVSSTAVAVDNTVVRTFGNQTIDGVKTFTNASNTFFGNGITPIGGIIMWSGAVSSIPSGWALCNGANGTPNLRNRFIVGAGGNYNPGDTGGSNSVTLTTSQIPAHSHTGSTASAGGHVHSGSTATAGAHAHTGSTATAGGHSHSGSTSGVGNHAHSITVYQTNSYQLGNNTALDRSGASTGSTGGAGAHSHSLNIDSAGAHTHSLSINSAGAHTHSLSINSAGAHTHTVTVGNTGGGQSHENRPPYYALAFIMRVA
jgi:microcystin-dependent protein